MNRDEKLLSAVLATTLTFWKCTGSLARPIPSGAQPGAPAWFDVRSRQIYVNMPLVRKLRLVRALLGVVGHEVGHHALAPCTIEMTLRLDRLSDAVFRGVPSLSNLFTDLLINGHLARSDVRARAHLLRILGRAPVGAARRDPVWAFYLTCLEESFGIAAGTLLRSAARRFERRWPRARAEARALLDDLGDVDLMTGFLAFLNALRPYIVSPRPSHPSHSSPTCCDCASSATADEIADSLRPSRAEQEAVARARSRGWLTPEEAERATGREAVDHRLASLAASGHVAQREAAAVLYRDLALDLQRQVPALPAAPSMAETRPGDLVEWEPGQPLTSFDALATAVAGGRPMVRVPTLRRDRHAEVAGIARSEIYLDVSGSMKEAIARVNALALAALVLSMATFRQKGMVRCVLFNSHRFVQEWTQSETEIARFVLSQHGGGTLFPFDECVESARRETGRPTRLVITDHDFDRNVRTRVTATAELTEAARASSGFFLMQVTPDASMRALYERIGLTVVHVPSLEDFPSMAAALSRALGSGRGWAR